MVAKRFRIGLAVAISAVFAAQLAVMPVTYAAASVATQAATQSAAQSGTPKFTESACQFDTTNQGLSGMTEGTDYRCGMVTVPEDHTKADNGKTIQIAVAVFKSTAATPAADPVIYLDGGPGGYSLIQAGDYLSSFSAFLAKRDVIMFDQRGTGYSKPLLSCDENTKLDHDLISVELSPAESSKRANDAALVCQKRLLKSGDNLSVYNSAQNAADVDAIRQALGYKMLDVYGISYGTRLALTVMRDFGKNVRSSVIDSVEPLDVDLIAGYIPNTQRVFKQLWDGCAADAKCNKAFPNLEKTFYDTVDKLNANPVTVKASDFTGQDPTQYDVVIDGNGLISFLFNSFYVTQLIPQLPALIYSAHNGKLDTIASFTVFYINEDKTISLGMYFSVNCQETVPFSSLDKVQAAANGVPKQIINYYMPGNAGEFDLCKQWGVKPSPAVENQAVKSDIPTLVMAGSYDPVTPPAYSKGVADELSKSYFVEIPDSGHGASLSSKCPFNIVVAFINDPTKAPNETCVKSIGAPKFVTTATIGQ